MKAKNIITALFVLLSLTAAGNPATAVVQKPEHNYDTTLVFDFAGVIASQKKAEMCDTLRSILRATAVEVAVVTVESLEGMDVEDYSQELFNTWEIGDKERQDGVLVLVKPKTGDSAEGRGQVRIHTGYGAEGFLPDLLCKHIQTDTMLPAFKKNDYAAGIMAAVNTIGFAARDEAFATHFLDNLQKQEEESKKEDNKIAGIVYFLLFLGCGIIIGVKRFFPAEDGYPKGKSPLQAAQAELFLAKWHKEHPDAGSSSRYDDDDDYYERRRRNNSSRSSSSSRSDWSFGGGRSGGGGASSSW